MKKTFEDEKNNFEYLYHQTALYLARSLLMGYKNTFLQKLCQMKLTKISNDLSKIVSEIYSSFSTIVDVLNDEKFKLKTGEEQMEYVVQESIKRAQLTKQLTNEIQECLPSKIEPTKKKWFSPFVKKKPEVTPEPEVNFPGCEILKQEVCDNVIEIESPESQTCPEEQDTDIKLTKHQMNKLVAMGSFCQLDPKTRVFKKNATTMYSTKVNGK